MTEAVPIVERVVSLEQNLIALKSKLDEREQLNADFRMRTDVRMETILRQLDEWAGARKALWVFGAIISAAIGWLVHGGYFQWGGKN